MTSIPLDPSLLKIQPVAQPATPLVAIEGYSAPPNNGWIQTLLIIAAIVVGFWFLSQRQGGIVDPPQPEPTRNIAAAVEAATRSYAHNLGVVMDRMASEVDAGELTTSEQMKNKSQAYTKAAREEAFKPIDLLDTEFISTDWDKSRIVKYLRQKSQGHERASK